MEQNNQSYYSETNLQPVGHSIEIFDNLLPKTTEDFLEKYIHNELRKELPPFPIHYIRNINTIEDPREDVGFAHEMQKYQDNQTTPNTLSLLSPLFALSFHKNFIPFNIYTSRVFLQTPKLTEKNINIHTDLPHPHWVCLYYVNDSSGDTTFYELDKKTEIGKASPKKGRIVLFDGTIPHIGGVSTKSTRTVINISFNKYNLNK